MKTILAAIGLLLVAGIIQVEGGPASSVYYLKIYHTVFKQSDGSVLVYYKQLGYRESVYAYFNGALASTLVYQVVPT